MKVVEINPDGSITIFFPEALVLTKNLIQMNNTKDINSIKNELLNIIYSSSMEKENPNRPILQNWTITVLSSNLFRLKLNFTNELYVSSMYVPDFIQI